MSKQYKDIKVVVMVPSPLTPRWQSNFCTDALAEVFDVEYWDCGAIVSVPFEATTVLERSYCKTISCTDELKSELKKLPKDTVCISHIHTDAPENYELHRLISSYHRDRVYVDFWASAITANMNLREDPNAETAIHKESLFRRIKHALYTFYPLQYAAKYIKHKNDGGFELWLSSQVMSKIYEMYNHYTVSTIPGSGYFINHPDYEKYLAIEKANEPTLIEGKYVVYIDQYFPVHPHLQVENPHLDCKALAQPYYESLNRFFDKVESQYNCKVVIAGHPVANYQVNPFGGRQIVYFKTAELVKHCLAVCMHTSYSISYMVLYNKPICLMTNSVFRQYPSKQSELERYYHTFELPIVDIDKVDDIHFTPLNEPIRQGFMNRFFDMNNHKTNAELMQENIIKIHEEIINHQ